LAIEKHDATQVLVQARDNFNFSDSQLQGSLFRFSDNQENKINQPEVQVLVCYKGCISEIHSIKCVRAL